MIVFTGLLIGIILGLISPGHIPDKFLPYVSMAILAGLDSVLGAIKSMLVRKFRTDIFISGFLGNSILAGILVYIGEKLGIPLHFAVVVVFGGRIFENFAAIRRYFLDKRRSKRK